MRLSATERIMREAEEAEAKATLDQSDDTKVSYVRSAEALEKLRSFELPSPTHERERPRARQTSARAHAASAPVRRPPAGLPQGRPRPAADPEPPVILAPEPPPPLASAPDVSAAPVVIPERTGIGRRLGFVVAAATATTVVLVLGAWMAHAGKLGRVQLATVPSEPSPPVIVSSMAGPLIAPIIEPAPPAVAPSPEPSAAVPSQPVANLADDGAAAAKESSAPQAAPTAAPPEARAVTAKKSRASHKVRGGKANKRKAHAAKVAKASRAAHARSATPAAPAATRSVSKPADSPDDVLPISRD